MLAFIMGIVAVLLVFVDQLTKQLAILYLKDQAAFVIWEGVFELRYCENTGVAFSMLENQRWLFIPVSVLVTVLVLVVLLRSPLHRYKLFDAACILVLAGGVGNLIDRVAYGFVVDFLYFRLIDFPIFNFADCCVVVGAVLLVVFLLFLYKGDEDLPMRTLLFGLKPKVKERSDGGE